jgi:hypothetical protein
MGISPLLGYDTGVTPQDYYSVCTIFLECEEGAKNYFVKSKKD